MSLLQSLPAARSTFFGCNIIPNCIWDFKWCFSNESICSALFSFLMLLESLFLLCLSFNSCMLFWFKLAHLITSLKWYFDTYLHSTTKSATHPVIIKLTFDITRLLRAIMIPVSVLIAVYVISVMRPVTWAGARHPILLWHPPRLRGLTSWHRAAVISTETLPRSSEGDKYGGNRRPKEAGRVL